MSLAERSSQDKTIGHRVLSRCSRLIKVAFHIQLVALVVQLSLAIVLVESAQLANIGLDNRAIKSGHNGSLKPTLSLSPSPSSPLSQAQPALAPAIALASLSPTSLNESMQSETEAAILEQDITSANDNTTPTPMTTPTPTPTSSTSVSELVTVEQEPIIEKQTTSKSRISVESRRVGLAAESEPDDNEQPNATTLIVDYSDQNYSLSSSTTRAPKPTNNQNQTRSKSNTNTKSNSNSKLELAGALLQNGAKDSDQLPATSAGHISSKPANSIASEVLESSTSIVNKHKDANNQNHNNNNNNNQNDDNEDNEDVHKSATKLDHQTASSQEARLSESQLKIVTKANVDDDIDDSSQPNAIDSRTLNLLDNLKSTTASSFNGRNANLTLANLDAFKNLLKKKAHSKYWSAEQKWDDLFERLMAFQDVFKSQLTRTFMKDIEYYADVAISRPCSEDMKFIRDYSSNSTNFRWIFHMLDSMGKTEPGQLTGNLAALGHVVQCIKVRAPSRASNHTIEERYYDQQTEIYGERFRGKYCLASVRPVMPKRPNLVTRFSDNFDLSLVSNVSFSGEDFEFVKQRLQDTLTPEHAFDIDIDRRHNRLDQTPFESELYEFIIKQRNFVYSLPQYLGVCFPSSCTQEDVRFSLQKAYDEQHQVVDIEFECEQEEISRWAWFNTSRLIAYVLLFLIVFVSVSISFARYILVSKMGLRRDKISKHNPMFSLLQMLDSTSMDKCAGVLFIKTLPASPTIDETKIENNRSTSIDALKGFLCLLLVYSNLVYLGCLPVPFMWAKWGDAMFPFYRSLSTQPFLNAWLWTEAFYLISAYVIALKFLENNRPRNSSIAPKDFRPLDKLPHILSSVLNRYIRLAIPMASFVILSYVWPRLSNGFVMQDQANKLMKPCDELGWTNFLLFHNYKTLNQTCLWPSHVGATFFQLHLISCPILLLLLSSLSFGSSTLYASNGPKRIGDLLLKYSPLASMLVLALIGLVYPALVASDRGLVIPFLVDYIDFDNYERVIELLVMPMYNHLSSYMFGIAIAFMVVRRRMQREARMAVCSDILFTSHREDSIESVDDQTSSSSQSIDLRSTSTKAYGDLQTSWPEAPKIQLRPSKDIFKHQRSSAEVAGFVSTLIASIGMFVALSGSWLWNGLGQPMSEAQTFWYSILSKLLFIPSFGHIFYRFFATRKNSHNPWMVTRFLVPIGRMSITVIYLGWLVTWFDLLSSPYQWYPSQYFVFEKFSEIIFITLILAMLAYGMTEGPIRVIQLAMRSDKLQNEKQKQLPASKEADQGFESMFLPN